MAKAKATKVRVTERALLQRINRKLAKENRKVLQQRAFYDGDQGPFYRDRELGKFYVVDIDRNAVVGRVVNLEELGRDVGALKPWEKLAKEAKQ